MKNENYISVDKNDDGIDRAGFLKCMVWAGTVNEKYFQVTHPLIGDSTISITCTTCHNGHLGQVVLNRI